MGLRTILVLTVVVGVAWPIAAQPPAELPKLAPPNEPRPAALPSGADGLACLEAGPCPECGPPGRVWANLEWLYWVTSGQSLPPLVTAAPPGTPRGAAGVLGQPATAVAFGGNRVNDDFRNGFRLTGGLWLDDDQTCGVEGDFFFLGRSRQGFAAASAGSPVLARPFFNTATGLPDAELVAFPGLTGRVGVDATSDVIGGGVNALHNLCCTPCGRLDVLWGYRYLGLTDEVTAAEDLTATAAVGRVLPGTRYQIADRFRTENHFHGGVLGLAGERRSGSWFVAGRASVALGGVRQITSTDGATVITPPGGAPVAFPGGLLALPSNAGRSERTAFAVLPEVALRGGVQVTGHARVYAGYTFLYLSDVARAGDQIDLRVNPNQLPPAAGGGPAFPQPLGRTTDFFIHGINLGVELRF
jgi:hypothetical protein